MTIPSWLNTSLSFGIITFATAIILHYARISLHCLRKTAGRDYLYWIACRDVRVWFVLIWVVLQASIMLFTERKTSGTLPFLYWAILLTPFCLLIKGLAPPQVLLLHTFDDRNYDFAKQLSRVVPLPNLVSLYPGARGIWDWKQLVERLGYGIGARVSSDAEWREVVRRYLNLAEVIVIDLSHARAGLIEELGFLKADESCHDKIVFVCGEVSEADFAHAEFRRLFPADVLYEHTRYPRNDVPVTRFNPLSATILSRLSTHYILPLLPPTKQQRADWNWTLCGPAGSKFLDEIQTSVNLTGCLVLRESRVVRQAKGKHEEPKASFLRLRFELFSEQQNAVPEDVAYLVGGWVNASVGTILMVKLRGSADKDIEGVAFGESEWSIPLGRRSLSSPRWKVRQGHVVWDSLQSLSVVISRDMREYQGGVEVEVELGVFPYDREVCAGNTEEHWRYGWLLHLLERKYDTAFEHQDVWL